MEVLFEEVGGGSRRWYKAEGEGLFLCTKLCADAKAADLLVFRMLPSLWRHLKLHASETIPKATMLCPSTFCPLKSPPSALNPHTSSM